MITASRPPLPLLITGVAGVAGYNALDYFQTRYPGEVIGIRQRDNWPLSGEGIVGCNAEDPDTLKRLFDEHQFKSVLNCAGNCALKSCELDPVMAERINVGGIANLLSLIQGTSTRLVHLSIDLVFSGAGEGGYTEDHATDPVTVYGKTMVDGEQLVAEARPDACVLRISLPMGVSFNGHAGAIREDGGASFLHPLAHREDLGRADLPAALTWAWTWASAAMSFDASLWS